MQLKLNSTSTFNRMVSLGCSLTKDNYQKTWADYLSQILELPLVNIAARGAGLDFLSKRLYAFDLTENDLVAIMLPSADRFDWFLDTDSPLKSNALSIASWQNGKNPSLVDLEGNEVKEFGFSLSGGNHRGYKKHWYKYFYSQTKAELDYWCYVISIQNFLTVNKISYFITSAYDRDSLIENSSNVDAVKKSYDKILKNVDFSNFIYYSNNQGFFSFCRAHGYHVTESNHPETAAHQHFAEYLAGKILGQKSDEKFDKR